MNSSRSGWAARAVVMALGVAGTGLVLLADPLPAQAAAKLELKTESFREVSRTGKDGAKVVMREPVTKAVPGQEIIYVITYRNPGTVPAADVRVDNAVPKGLVYRPGSAEGAGTRIELSVDGGKHFGELGSARVVQPGGASRPARGEDVTNIRWLVLQPVEPGAEGSVSYRVLLP